MGLLVIGAKRRFTPTGVGTACFSRWLALVSLGSPPRAWGRLLRVAFDLRRRQVHPHGRGDGF